MTIDRYVTEWGMPGLTWVDQLGNMTGMPHSPKPPVPQVHLRPIERRLWIGCDGVQVCALDAGQPAVAGHWDEWQSLVLGTTREDLSPQYLTYLEHKRLLWVEHQKITAYFTDGTVNRLACSAVSHGEMAQVHEAIMQTFVRSRPRGKFVPPASGYARPRGEAIEPYFVAPEPGEESMSQWNLETPEKMRFFRGPDGLDLSWLEPIASTSKGMLGFGKKQLHHAAHKIIFVAKADSPLTAAFTLFAYHEEGYILTAAAPLAFLEGFSVIDQPSVLPSSYNPVTTDLIPGYIIVASFRYGYRMPLTCIYDDKASASHLCAGLENAFLPLVGRQFSDAELLAVPQASEPAKPLESTGEDWGDVPRL